MAGPARGRLKSATCPGLGGRPEGGQHVFRLQTGQAERPQESQDLVPLAQEDLVAQQGIEWDHGAAERALPFGKRVRRPAFRSGDQPDPRLGIAAGHVRRQDRQKPATLEVRQDRSLCRYWRLLDEILRRLELVRPGFSCLAPDAIELPPVAPQGARSSMLCAKTFSLPKGKLTQAPTRYRAAVAGRLLLFPSRPGRSPGQSGQVLAHD